MERALAILGRVVKEGVTKKLIFEESSKGSNHAVIWRKNVPWRGNRKRGACLGCWRNSKEASVARVE